MVIYEKLWYSNESIQICAFVILKRLVAEYVEEESLKVELRVDEDETNSLEFLDKLPAYLFGFLNRDLTQRTQCIGFLLNWMLIITHFENAVQYIEIYNANNQKDFQT